jgi:hypothetical protein
MKLFVAFNLAKSEDALYCCGYIMPKAGQSFSQILDKINKYDKRLIGLEDWKIWRMPVAPYKVEARADKSAGWKTGMREHADGLD